MDSLDSPGPAPESPPEIADRFDEEVVTIPCYEPSNLRVGLSYRSCCSHTLILGQTGSGKTSSALRWIVKGLIAHACHEPAQRPGIFIFDLNGDDTVAVVQKWAAECGRSHDVRLLTPDDGHFDLFAGLQSLEDLATETAQFMQGAWASDSDNAYWHETTRMLIDAALSICLIVYGKLETDSVIRFLTNWLIAHKPTTADQILLEQFEKICREAPQHLDPHLLQKIEFVRATVEMWGKLDLKTRGILISCLANALGAFISLEVRRYLDHARGASFDPAELPEGRIMVFSLPAGRHLEAASLLGRLIKARLYTSLQDRPQRRDQRLCVVIADEYHYLASGGVDRSSDVTALATLRSRCVGVVAATQSLDHLLSVIGTRDFHALIPNFGSHFFFRSTERSTGAFASLIMGTRARPREEISAEDMGDVAVSRASEPSSEYVCPPGALAGLQPSQAYVSIAGGYRSPGPIWLGGNHEVPEVCRDDTPPKLTGPTALDRLRLAALGPQTTANKAPSSGKGAAQGDKKSVRNLPAPCYDHGVWATLLREHRFRRTSFTCFKAFCRELAEIGQRPAGVETLPVCWWDAVARLVREFAEKHEFRILRLSERRGCLEVAVAGDENAARNWIGTMQRSLYPIRTRRLKQRDLRIITQAEGMGESFDHKRNSEGDDKR